jgi:hypothetical protein
VITVVAAMTVVSAKAIAIIAKIFFMTAHSSVAV